MLNLGWSLVWTIINLIIFYLLMKRFLVGPVLGIMEKRKNLIAQELENAKAAQEKAEELKGHYEGALAGAKEESAQIIEAARADAKSESERMVKEANLEAAKIIENARVTAEQEKENALQGAKSEIAGLALEAARKLLSEGSTEKGNSMLYDEFLAKAGDGNDTDVH
ncbi:MULTISPECIES: F0F1 ATP synthase subunit B [unclassified Blautia]|uniref:ATP synthase subunit b n=1 Tax=Candidatus Blautia merdigallinarum TaxID=2838495 RepID=A0A9D2N6N2_9FIRM|nr:MULTISPECIES: F0F1 ATP synthase subunit B [unclassified Blautia]OUN31153.1 ATP synthase F0 subunit B [Blautia sp. An81]OUN92730.1 ATP synthase F0 subunit B [Blautia sp. An46]HJC11119.1 F0F1 ATP synthase subunit B [Candidatus Blautia merdigallinarum]HJD37744.1 F0F1 ATP synthase subunit B [Candidatus Blautia ornithocaccae]